MRNPLASHWRRFRPQQRLRQMLTPTKRANTQLWQQARERADELFPGRQLHADALEQAIKSARDTANASNDAVEWCTAMILQAPRAAAAQEQMDQHPHGYHNKHARLFELIDFNDTYVSAVLSAPEEELAAFAEEAKKAMDAFCKRVRARCFSNEQFEAITHGLSQEIAVYRGAIQEGYGARMTNRVDDAFGIDMVISDESGESINIDCKTRSAFYYRLKDLMREGRLTTEAAGIAEDNGYCWIINGDETRQEHIALLRLDEETYGNVQDFTFVTTAPLGMKLREIFDGVTAGILG